MKSILPTRLSIQVQPEDLRSATVALDIERILMERFPHPYHVQVGDGRVYLRKGEDRAVYGPSGRKGGCFDMFAFAEGKTLFLRLTRL